MQGKLREVTQLPLTELWDEHAPLEASRRRHLSEAELRQLLRTRTVHFVVADVGHPLRWIPIEESFAFWKLEVRPHLVDEPDRPFDVDRFPEGYRHVASEWRGPEDDRVMVVLERHH